MKKLRTLLLLAISFMALSAPLLAPAVAHAESETNKYLCGGVELKIGEPCDPNNPGVEDKINEVIANGLNLFSGIVGIIAVVMVIIGGVTYITSSGDAAKVTKAKNTVLYALIGLVVVALAQIIVQFVLGKFAG